MVKSGVLVVDKPEGPTSFDVVRTVRRALGAAKAGHAGTLDPMATGVLVVCIEEAVKLQHVLTDGEKGYLATVLFGVATDTEDAQGRVIATGDPAKATEHAVRTAAATLVGELEQRPPMYSAVRVGGRRLHEAARAGEEVDRPVRTVHVHSVDVEEVGPAEGGIAARIRVRCGKGTYIRTLAVELGLRVGVPAHLASLRRTLASGFTLAQATPLADVVALSRAEPQAMQGRVLCMAEALPRLPRVDVDEHEAALLAHGQPLSRAVPLGQLLRAVDSLGRLVALLEPNVEGLAGARPVRVFSTG